MDLHGKTALITGAGSGIGRAIALRLASLGMNLALCGRNAERLSAVAEQTGRPADMLALAGDLTDEAHLSQCVARTCARFGGLDVLINNAGMALSCPFEATTTEQYDRILSINARTPFLLCRHALGALRTSDCASIINIGSVVAHNGYALQSAYAASKHALLGMTKALAKEVYADGIRVQMISPGGVDTDMIRVARPDLTGDGMIAAGEIADTVEFLLTHRGNAMIDEIQLHRSAKEPFLS